MKQNFKKSLHDQQIVKPFVEVFDNILGSIREPLVVLDSDYHLIAKAYQGLFERGK